MIEDLIFNNAAGAQIELGSVGWEGEDDYFFSGEHDNDGHTLVRVQLFRGRDNTKPLGRRAQGVKIVCHVLDGKSPPVKDARCYIAIPQGMDNVPGAGVILGTIGGGNERNRNITPGDTIIQCAGGGEACIILKPDGSITFHTTDTNLPNGRSVFLRISPSGYEFTSPYGYDKHNVTGRHIWTTCGDVHFDFGGIAIPLIPSEISDLFSSYCTITAGVFRAKATSVFLGAGKVYNPVIAAPISPGNPPPHALPALTLAELLQSGGVWVAP